VTVPAVLQYVETLRRQLDQLCKSAGSVQDSAYREILAEYEEETTALMDELELPMFPSYIDPAPEDEVATGDVRAPLGSAAATEKMIAALQAAPGANNRMLNARAMDLHAQNECAPALTLSNAKECCMFACCIHKMLHNAMSMLLAWPVPISRPLRK
jgi:hypothetical protein